MTVINQKTGRPWLRYDLAIENAARSGDNDLALELSIWQRQYMEMYCDQPEELQEWERRKAEGSK